MSGTLNDILVATGLCSAYENNPFISSEFGSPVYIKRGTLFLMSHWALVIDDREYHLVYEDGQPKLKDAVHKTAHLPDTHSPFSGKYCIGWTTMDKEALWKELKTIEGDFGRYKFGENDCRTFVALACDKALDGQILTTSPCVLIWLPLYLSLMFRHAPFSLTCYGFLDSTLLHLSFHLIQTLTDGYEVPFLGHLLHFFRIRGKALQWMGEVKESIIVATDLLYRKTRPGLRFSDLSGCLWLATLAITATVGAWLIPHGALAVLHTLVLDTIFVKHNDLTEDTRVPLVVAVAPSLRELKVILDPLDPHAALPGHITIASFPPRTCLTCSIWNSPPHSTGSSRSFSPTPVRTKVHLNISPSSPRASSRYLNVVHARGALPFPLLAPRSAIASPPPHGHPWQSRELQHPHSRSVRAVRENNVRATAATQETMGDGCAARCGFLKSPLPGFLLFSFALTLTQSISTFTRAYSCGKCLSIQACKAN
ncbi:hypothetical protein MSAN_01638600 [Mycena sanguinolenta]|uniref:Uncharacterized protein n=1 Tax=Mycena sanguinolenta TaxID=230812 RepID=A0A8H6Y1N5_9AGAR|nr:hypothetical protein MSAN_01638600 [Mycena sanguinolenta]